MSGIEQGRIAPEGEETLTPNPDQVFLDRWGDMLWEEVQKIFEGSGRGAVLIDMDTAVRMEEEKDKEGHDLFLRYGYVDFRNVEEMGKPDLIRKVQTYDPATEFIAIFIRQGETTSYRVAVALEEDKPTQTQETG